MGWLTTDSPMSHYGIPVLRFADEFDDQNRTNDYGPADMIEHGDAVDTFGPETSAEFICRWVDGQCDTLSSSAVAAAKLFLRQWPDGPQISD